MSQDGLALVPDDEGDDLDACRYRCDPRTHLITPRRDDPDQRPRRCPDCHPLRASVLPQLLDRAADLARPLPGPDSYRLGASAAREGLDGAASTWRVEHVDPFHGLHGEALARAQVAESRARRAHLDAPIPPEPEVVEAEIVHDPDVKTCRHCGQTVRRRIAAEDLELWANAIGGVYCAEAPGEIKHHRPDFTEGARDSADPWGGPPSWVDPGGPEVPGPRDNPNAPDDPDDVSGIPF